MVDSEFSKPKRQWPWYSFIIAAAPVLGYLLAFYYESEFCNVFGIPHELIALSWATFIITFGSFLGISVFLFSILQMPYVLRCLGFPKPGPIKGRFLNYSILIFMSLCIFIRYHAFIPQLGLIFLIPICFMIIEFVGPLMPQKEIRGYAEKLAAQQERDTMLIKSVPTFVLNMLLVVTILFLCSGFEGKKAALTQEFFMVPSINTHSIVLRVYGDKLICAPFDRESGRVEKSFFFIELGSDSTLMLVPEKVGPLKSN